MEHKNMPKGIYKRIAEARKKMSLSHIGYVMPESQRKKISDANKGGNSGSFKLGSKVNLGKKHSTETIEKIKLALKGKVPWNKGILMSEETKKKLSKKFKGVPNLKNRKENPITPLNTRIRRSIEYRLWRESVFARDNWTCQECKTRGGELHPHHVKPFALFPELRFAIDNGLTLCAGCHRQTDTWGINIKQN